MPHIVVTVSRSPAEADDKALYGHLLQLQYKTARGHVGCVSAYLDRLAEEFRPALDRLAVDASTAGAECPLATPLVVLLSFANCLVFGRQACRRYRMTADMAGDVAQIASLKLLQRFSKLGQQPLDLQSYQDVQKYVRRVIENTCCTLWKTERGQSYPKPDDWMDHAVGMTVHRTPSRYRGRGCRPTGG